MSDDDIKLLVNGQEMSVADCDYDYDHGMVILRSCTVRVPATDYITVHFTYGEPEPPDVVSVLASLAGFPVTP